MKQQISCPCGNTVFVEYEEEVDLDLKQELLGAILNGSFMNYECSSCGKKHKPEYKITIIWKSKNLKMEVIPEMQRGEFYRNKKETAGHETIIGFPEMAERLTVINDDLEPVAIEALKSILYAKADENYPDKDVNIWYYCKHEEEAIEFHIDGIRSDEVAVMKLPLSLYQKTLDDYKKHPKSDFFASLRVRSYLSVQNLMRHELLK